MKSQRVKKSNAFQLKSIIIIRNNSSKSFHLLNPYTLLTLSSFNQCIYHMQESILKWRMVLQQIGFNVLLQVDWMDDITAKKVSRIRIVLLKEAPPTPTIYEQPRPYIRITRSQDPAIARSRHVRTSIAHLSSILQDEHLHTEKSTAQPSEGEEIDMVGADADTGEKLDHLWKNGKKSNRYLSCLLETEEVEGLHAKTEGIEKLLQRRKILPIDKIYQRRKNITFSLKNKRELNQDFHEFINKKTLQSATQPPPQVGQRETISFPMKHSAEKRVATLRNEKRRGKQMIQHLQILDQHLAVASVPIPNRKARVESREGGYAVAFKRISSDIPQMNCFQWSRLDQAPYHLIKG